MVTRLEAVTRIKRRLSFRTNLDNEIVSELQAAQRSLERGHSLPWFLKQEDQILSFTSGNPSAALPTGFLREVEDQSLSYRLDDMEYPFFPEKKDWEDAFDAYAAAEDGLAQVYVLRKNTIYVFPTPDRDYEMTWGFYKADDILSADSTENQWLLHAEDLLMGKAGKILADDIQNQAASAAFAGMMSTGWAEVFADGIEREASNRDYRLGAGL